jgi:molybdopterin synthase sulfur carrier subunit
MLKVLFFARIKEQLNCASLDVEWREVMDIDSLQEQLCTEQGNSWAEVLGQENIIRAVNQVIVDGNTLLRDGDEVAFFPPVTGG